MPSDAQKRLFVLDTNVLMHDPTALYRFQEHNIFIPMVVLEELDRSKKGLSEVARNVRQVSRFLDELMAGLDQSTSIEHGIELPSLGESIPTASESVPTASVPRESISRGRLFFQTRPLHASLPDLLPGNTPDNTILNVVIALQQQESSKRSVTLVSKDINLRIKATILGIHAEDYYNDQVLDDVTLLYSGNWHASSDFWQTHSQDMASWSETGRTFYRIHGSTISKWYPNQCIVTPGEQGTEVAFIVRSLDNNAALLERLKDYSHDKNAVWGICARNHEQNFALNLLLDPEIEFVTLLGAAGTGKTLLALAAGLAQTLDHKRYREIIMTRVTVPVGEDIGFLPGTEEEKMTPWMGALTDNLEVLSQNEEGGSWGRAATQDLLSSRIKIHSLNFMRGRTFLNKYVIIDEAQNLTAKQMKTLITRAGPGTKIVCLGNIAQIDTPYLTETSSGLTYVVDRFKPWPHGGHATLQRGERSRLAEFASERL